LDRLIDGKLLKDLQDLLLLKCPHKLAEELGETNSLVVQNVCVCVCARALMCVHTCVCGVFADVNAVAL
jgi:hypothetical protein